MDNAELEAYVETLSEGVREQYSLHKKRQRKFSKTFNAITELLKSRDYPPSLLRQSSRTPFTRQ